MIHCRSSIFKGIAICGRWRTAFGYAAYGGMVVHRVPLLAGRVVRCASTSDAACSDQSSSVSRRGGGREPHLRRLSVVRPDLVNEWVPELNDVDVGSVPFNSPLTVWWRCNACGENYEATVRDRAVSEKGCPRCTLVQRSQHVQDGCGGGAAAAAAAVETQTENTVLGQDVAAPSLVETHPALALRWDDKRNGLLRPSDVTSTSELNVWWRPADGRPPHEQSFRRPVHAFVEMPYSIEEQQEAESLLQLDILRQVRQAAKIDEARDHGTLPAAAQLLDDVVSKAQGGILFSLKQQQQYELVGEDLHKAIELWEHDFDAKVDAAYRHLFYLTDACDGAGVSRDQVLSAYDHFVTLHRDREKGSAADPATVPSAITDPDWIQHFTLTVEDVAKDRFAPTAQLVLPPHGDEASAVAREQQMQVTHNVHNGRHRVSSLPAPPEEYKEEIHTMFAPIKRQYPRRPRMPPSREDDVSEVLPMGLETNKMDSVASPMQMDESSVRRPSKGGTPSEATFEVMSLASAQSLVQDYATVDDKSMPFDVEEKDLHLRTLLGPTAIRSMTAEEVRTLQYSRGAPKPRRTGRFRLRHPDACEMAKKDALSVPLGATAFPSAPTEEEQVSSQAIQAPGSPRKVARPSKRQHEAN